MTRINKIASFSDAKVPKKYIQDILAVYTPKDFLYLPNGFTKILTGKVNLLLISVTLKPFETIF